MAQIGYLTPEGTLIECASYGHTYLASDIVDSMVEKGEDVPLKAKMNGVEAECFLMTIGYIAVRDRDCYGHIGYYIDGTDRRLHMTDEQKKWLLDHYGEFISDKQRSVDKLFDWDK